MINGKFLINFIVFLGITAFDQINLPCSSSSEAPGVYWPDLDNGTCSASIPSCTTPEGYLGIRCCDDGRTTAIHCTKNDTNSDPSCLGNMRSTVDNVDIEFCYEFVNDTVYPFNCTSRTGLMIPPKFEILSLIGGNDTGIWLPIEKYLDTFRYITVNPFYMDPIDQVPNANSSKCLILLEGAIKAVSCKERYLGICLDFPRVVYRLQSNNDLYTLLSQVKEDYCTRSEYESNDFCSYFKQGYHLNLEYFSSRNYANTPFIILQKSNLRLILQIRKDDMPRTDGTVFLHASLSSTDWDIFMNKSFTLTHFDASEESIYKIPKLNLIAEGNFIDITKSNPMNIKWTERDDSAHSIFCFFTIAPKYHLEKIEVVESFQIDVTKESGVFWCEAFDHDLNIISSNYVTFGDQTLPHYVSEMQLSVGKVQTCDNDVIRDRIDSSFITSKRDKKFNFYTRSITVLDCNPKITRVYITTYWYPKKAAQQIDEIDSEYEELKTEIEMISKGIKGDLLNISKTVFLRHSDFCLKETFPIEGFSYVWPTTPSRSYTNSCSYFFKENHTEVMRRNCLLSSLGSYWSSSIKNSEPITNLTQLLEEIHKREKLCKSVVLNNLNMVIEKYPQEFYEHDVHLVSKILSQLNKIDPDLEGDIKYLSLFVNNLHFIKTDVLKNSQEKYQTTDSIMNSSDALYLSTQGSQNLTEAKHCYYTIDFEKHPKATGVILRISGNNHETMLHETDILPIEPTKGDEFEAVIFFDDTFLNEIRKHKEITFLKFSIFFDNYLFDVNHPSVTTKSIFKVLLPDNMEMYPRSFMTMSNQKSGGICACWKYANIDEKIVESKWYRTVKYENASHSFCIFETASYCTIFSAESVDADAYVSVILIHYAFPLRDPHIIIRKISELLYHYFIIDGASYELISIKSKDLLDQIGEVKVVWKLDSPAETIPEIEKEYRDLKHSIQNLSKIVSKTDFVEWMDLKYLRHRRYCLNDVYKHDGSAFIFKTIGVNEYTSSSPSCCKNGRKFLRQCRTTFESGALWEDVDPQFYDSCSSNVTEGLAYLLEHFSDQDANTVLNNLEQITNSTTSNFNSVDIYLLSEIFFLISDSAGSQELDLSSLSALTSNIQELDRNVLRNAQIQFNATDKILGSLDRILLQSNITTPHKNTRFYTVELNNVKRSEGLILQRDGSDYNISIIPGALDNPYSLERYEDFVAGVFFNDFFPNRTIIVSIFFEDVLFVDSKWKHHVSLIFGILLPNQNVSGNIELVFKNRKGRDKACAYWKYGVQNSLNVSGRWKNESEPNEKLEFTTCKYNHTTHFAMLINDDSSDPEYLKVVTNIGCCLSIIGLLGILITGIIFERWRKNLGNIILMNFVLTVLIQICLYYCSSYIHKVINESDSCVLIGALLHYTVVSEFCWMLVIAILQFKRFVQVLTRPPKFVLFKAFLVGWGIPVIPVLSLLLIDSKNYTSSLTGLCYPSGVGLYFGVWLPIFVITIMNLIIFFRIMCSICNRKTECVDTVSNEMIFQWRLAVLLFFMLGLTWTFAIASEFVLRDIFAYLFCITATLQGFIMFLFFIVFNERTRLLYSVLFQKMFSK